MPPPHPPQGVLIFIDCTWASHSTLIGASNAVPVSPLQAQGKKVAALVINTRQDRAAAIAVPLASLGLAKSTAVTEIEVWSGNTTQIGGVTTWQVRLPAGGHRWGIFEA